MQPKLIEGFNGQKIVAIATGDEFSLAVDEKGLLWVWGKGDKGQVSVCCGYGVRGTRDR